jgi:hypothetical protein
LAYALLGLLVPVGVGVVIVAATKTSVSLGNLTDGGQFAIYTSEMLAGTVYLITRPSGRRLPLTEWFGWAALVGLVFATAFFVLALLSSVGEDINCDFFQWPSIGLAIIALAIAFVAVKMDLERMGVEPLERARDEQEELRKKFRRIGESRENGNGS